MPETPITAPTDQSDIAKLAISLLKGEDITSISPADAGSKEARVMALWFAAARQYALEQHPWAFARARRAVSADATAPAFEYTARFELPPDFIRFVRIGEVWYDPDMDYQREGNFLLWNDAGPLKLVYIYDHTDISKWTPTFKMYMAYVLAAFGCYDITGAKDMILPMLEAAEDFLSKNKSINAQGRPPRKIQRSRVAAARFGLSVRQDEPWRWGDN